MKDILGVRRLNAVLVPKDLTFDQKNARKETASLNLEATTDDPELLKRVITGDETWINGFDSETTQQASEWRFKNEPRPKKARKAPSKAKVMLTVFFDYQGIVHHKFQQQGSTITADSYLGILRRLREAIRQKRPVLWRSKSWILHHDNAPAHTALKISKFLQLVRRPDLAPCDFFLFGKLKKKLKGRKFQSIEEIKVESKKAMKAIPKTDYQSFHGATTGERVHLRTPFCNRFFTAKNETAVNIHRNLVSVYGEECMSIQMVRRWRSWFLEGRQNVHDDERSGRPVTATDNAAAAAVRNVVEADRRVTIDEIMIRLPPGIEIGRSSIGTIMSDILNFRKVCARWVPRLLLENHKQQRMEAARAFLEMHQRDGDQLFPRIVTGDESWVHHSTPETKRQNMVWKKPEESAPKKAKVTISAGKVMAMENFKWEIFTHPPYSPEFAPSDFHLFPALKWHLGGKHFANDDEVQAEENHWLRRQDTAWYNSGIKKLLQRYQKCLDRNGDYLEK
ncbi:hypothetical protein LAZ67_17001118 [Cordylochernes scorpioides]|uniref:Transposase n=1 Tax=Cordylochernes scorpioides TaxID=51811 RepID=A0ABY6LFR1_9ARAC|nr:hypothetical protein LAZ67_17001118 [Cordylochernes scorpioides]